MGRRALEVSTSGRSDAGWGFATRCTSVVELVWSTSLEPALAGRGATLARRGVRGELYGLRNEGRARSRHTGLGARPAEGEYVRGPRDKGERSGAGSVSCRLNLKPGRHTSTTYVRFYTSDPATRRYERQTRQATTSDASWANRR